MFTVPEAARLLQVAPSTLAYWLDGGVRAGRTYRPVIRTEPTPGAGVTWAEFVESGLLRAYRTHHVPMRELRAFIDLLRGQLGVPYPLADRRPFVADKQLVLQAQEESDLGADYCLVAVVRGQLILTPPAEDFVERVTWDGDLAARWRPHADPDSPVRMDPQRRFGRPAVGGVSTEVLWEQVQAGEDAQSVAEAFDLTDQDVHWAVNYETSVRAARAA